jgi:predicted permease
MLTVFFIVLPIFLVISLGKGLQLKGLIDTPFIKTANRLLFNVCLPALLFYKISNANIHHILNINLLLIMTGTVIITFGLAFAVTKTSLVTQKTRGSFMMNSFRANFAYMGLPVSYYAFGDTGLLHASIFMAFVVPLVNFFAVLSLGLFSKRNSISAFIGNTLFNPLAIACIAGLTSSYMNMVYPDFVTRTLTIISGVTLPLALFCIGASLTIQQLRGNIFVILLSSGLKLLLMPAITLVLLWLFNQPIDPMAKVLVVMMASPSATVNSIMAATMGGDTHSTNGTIVTTTLLSIFSFIFWLACLGI